MKSLRRIVSWSLAMLFVYAALESGYRIYRYRKLKLNYAKHVRYGFSSFESPLDVLDTETGFVYKPNSHLHQRLYDAEGALQVHTSSVITNNFGLISPSDILLDKPESEFRIAVLGDSFCATTTSNTTWPTALERLLNQDRSLMQLVGKSSFEVLNFGLDGTGLVQWPDVYKHKAERFHPDLVIVNFIWSDLFRKYMYRDTLKIGDDDYAMISCTGLPAVLGNPACQNSLCFMMDPVKEDYRGKSERIKREFYDQSVHNLPWYAPYPELLAVLLKGRFGLTPRLNIQNYTAALYTNPEEAIHVGLDSLTRISSMNSKLLVFFHPTIEECVSRQTPDPVQEFVKQAKDFKVVNMLDTLPVGLGEAEIRKWYNLPFDSHPSDHGAEVYAQAVKEQLRAYWKGELSSKPKKVPARTRP